MDEVVAELAHLHGAVARLLHGSYCFSQYGENVLSNAFVHDVILAG